MVYYSKMSSIESPGHW